MATSIKGNTEVRRTIHARIEAENAVYIQRQHDFTDLMNQKRKKAEAQRAVIEAKKTAEGDFA